MLAVHIVTSNSEDFSFFNETINLIKGGSKLKNISIHPKHNYTESENSVHYPLIPDCTLFIIIKVNFLIILHINLVLY